MKKKLSILLALSLLAACLSGCGGTSSSTQAASSQTSESVQEAAESTAQAAETAETQDTEAASEDKQASSEDTYESIFPLDERVTFTAWAMWIPGIEQYVDSPADTQVFQQLEELTNVSIDMTLASSPDTAMTEINLIIASGEYPDFINNFASYYSAGIDSAIENEIIYDINDFEDLMPNYYAALESRGAIDDATSDGGAIGAVYQINSSYDSAQAGMVLREDWMEEQGFDAPTTYDELHDILMTFKEVYNTTETLFVPKTGIPDTFFDGFGSGLDFIMNNEMGSAPWNYVETDDGLEVVFGFMDDSFYDALTLLNSWYNDGLFSGDYLNHNYNLDVSDMTTGESACLFPIQNTLNAANSYQEHMYKAYPNVSEDGEAIVQAAEQYSALSAQGYSITTSCEDTELAAQYLDYMYTDEAYTLLNYGVEGVSFEYNDAGEPVLTDIIMNNPDGIPQAYAQFLYLGVTGSFYCDSDRFKGNYCEEAKECFDVWDSAYDYYDSPYNTQNVQLSTEETEEYSQRFSDISTYCNEKVAAFITGQTALTEENFEEFRSNMVSMGIEDCTALWQAAADRYVASLAE
jgi:putative aldouronate transport system substrate-binding protein